MNRGGSRAGAGRPSGSGKYGEATKAVRVPLSQIEEVMQWIENKGYRLPLYQSAVSAGFPSAADGEMERALDLNELLIKHPAATFFVRVNGHSMIGAGIHHNDILVVDRSLKPVDGKIVIAAINGELTVKRLLVKKNRVVLLPENSEFSPIEVGEGTDFHIWGVVTSVIHSV